MSQQTFRILVLGDFSGRERPPAADVGDDVARRRPIEVNRDNLDQVMARLSPRCDAGLGDTENHVVSLRFQRLEHFHPDSLYQSLPLFAQLKQLREKLHSPATYDKAAQEVREWGLLQEPASDAPEPDPVELPPSPARATLEPPSGAGLLDQAIGQTEQTKQTASAAQRAELPGDLARLVRRAVEPYRLAKPAPDQADLVACVDAVASRLMRSILHDRRFQALESAWRAMALLTRRLPTGPQLKLYLLDIGLDELAADLGSAADIDSTGIHQVLVDQAIGTPGAGAWQAILANYTFDAAAVDLLIAGCLARIAARAGSPVIAGANPRLLGCDWPAAIPDPASWRRELGGKIQQAWQYVRTLPEAAYLGLVLPRFLLRAPYGAHACPLEGFPFEERTGGQDHESLLWGNSALACGCLLGDAFSQNGWDMKPWDSLEIDGLPLCGSDVDGEYQLQPTAEVLISQRTGDQILAAGLMPLLSIKATDAARLMAWRSVAATGATLAGPWR